MQLKTAIYEEDADVEQLVQKHIFIHTSQCKFVAENNFALLNGHSQLTCG